MVTKTVFLSNISIRRNLCLQKVDTGDVTSHKIRGTNCSVTSSMFPTIIYAKLSTEKRFSLSLVIILNLILQITHTSGIVHYKTRYYIFDRYTVLPEYECVREGRYRL